MTFRIDRVFLLPDGRWTFDVKGIRGRGVYGTLESNPGGCGLFILAAPGAISRNTLVSEEIRLLPPDCSFSAAVQRVAAVLLVLGWGPEVDDREALSLQTCRGSNPAMQHWP